MSRMFRSFATRNYRVWFIGAFVGNVGMWMQATAVTWVVLTELTRGDAAAMGITIAVQFAPPLVLVGVTGWVADRFDRRGLLMFNQAVLALLGLALGILILLGSMTLMMMYGFALALGIATAFDTPARQAFVSDLVVGENASNAVALNAASINGARMIGPAAGGLVIVALGTEWVFVAGAATCVVLMVALAIIRPQQLVPRVRRAGPERISDGIRYIARRPDLAVTFAMVFVFGALSMNFPIYASTMTLEFGQDAGGFGLLSSLLALGSLAGALAVARNHRARFRVVVVGAAMFAVAGSVSAFMPTFWTYAATLVVTGFAVVTMLATANAYVQTTTEPALRGRVLALYLAALMGGMPLGALAVGWVAAQFGPRWAIIVGAGAAFTSFAIGSFWLFASGRLRRNVRKRFSLTLHETGPIRIIGSGTADFSELIVSATPPSLSSEQAAPRRVAHLNARMMPSIAPGE